MTRNALLRAYADPELSAKLARVRYQRDDVPGWGRQKQGRGFTYTDVKGTLLRRAKDIERIEALRIPPAWKDVWIAPSARAHIQATGIDAKGRKQYLYHERWSAFRERLKFSRLAAFGLALPKLRRAIAGALAEEEPTRRKVAALALSLIDELAIRVGSEAYAKENDTYGVTTLRTKHVSIEGDTVTLAFTGKSHQEHELELTDKKLAGLLQEEEELPGYRLFQYVDENGARHPLTAADVNAFMHDVLEADFTAKDFRTWIGTVHAYELMREACSASEAQEWGEKEYLKSLRGVIKEVAGRLGNTVAVTKAHYVHADLQAQYACGTFRSLAKRLSRRKRIPGLGARESEVAALLELFTKNYNRHL